MTQKMARDERTQQIITAAVNEFLEKDYEGASMAAIAQRAGITKGGLYHHFRSKDDIVIAAVQTFAQPLTEALEEALSRPKAAEALGLVISVYLQHWDTHRRELAFYFLSMIKVPTRPHLADLYLGLGEAMADRYAAVFQRGQQSGEFRPHDASARGAALMTALDGAAGYLLVDAGCRADRFAEQLRRVLVDDLLPTGGEGR